MSAAILVVSASSPLSNAAVSFLFSFLLFDVASLSLLISALENLGCYMKFLDDSGFAKVLETQSQFGRAIENLINKKDTKGIEAGLNFIKGQEGGFDSALGKSFHDGIINRLFTNSTSKIKGKLQIDLAAYRKYVQQLKDNGIFDTFDKKTKK